MAGKKITELISGSITSLPLSGVTTVVYSGTTFQHNLTHLRQTLVDSGSHHFTGSQYISGTLLVSGSIRSTEIVETVNMNVSNQGHIQHLSVGTFGFPHVGNPESLRVENSGSINIAHFEADHQYYSQINVKNKNSGSNASSDISVTADNGDESVHFVNLGINSSTYQGGFVGRENDAYLLNVGKDMYIGTIGGENHPSKLFLFGQNNWENPQITVSGSGQVSFNTCSCDPGYTYQFSGSAKLQNDVNIVGELSIGSVSEKLVLEIGGGESQYEFDYHSGSVFYLTGSLSNNSYNVTNTPTEEQRAVSITFVIKQESTPYIASSYKINDETVTVSWAGNEQPTSNANKTDVIGLTALRVGSSWNVLGTFTTFG